MSSEGNQPLKKLRNEYRCMKDGGVVILRKVNL
ncbi:uncharacterized protein METZ01_LOCUS120401 [marine metagenome]|uniref:Uncharacterized protein n=1 Tax=marine metagenome TaxID=408172 RepID=A0A381XTM0_9ZZZZ